MIGRSWALDIEQAKHRPASDVAEGIAVRLSMFLGGETCKLLEGNRAWETVHSLHLMTGLVE